MKPLVAVKWLDAHGSGNTAYAEYEIPHAGILITTYGLLLKDDEVGVTVANEVCADNTYRGCTFILRGMVLSVTPVIKSKRKKATPPITEEVAIS